MANEKRSRTNLVAGALSAGISNSDTTMSSAGLADLGVIDATNHAAVTLFTADSNGRITSREIVYVTAHTAAATSATIVRAQESTTAAAWSTGATWAHAPTKRDLSMGRLAFAQRTSGSLSPSSTSWTNVDTALDLTLTAQVGDVIEFGTSFQTENEASTLRVDVGTLVSGSIVNYFGGATDPSSNYGVSGWTASGGVAAAIAGSLMRTMVSGDLSAGTVTLRLRCRCDSAAVKTLHAQTARPLQVWAKNHGPVES